MEALAAFGLVCNVFQTVDFSVKIVETFRNARAGAPNPQLEKQVHGFSQLHQRLKTNLEQVQSGKAAGGSKLLDITTECLNTSQALENEIRRLSKSRAKGRLLQALSKTTKTILASSKIEELKENMLLQQRLLDSELVVHGLDKMDGLAIHHDSNFRALDNKLQSLVQRFLSQQISLEALDNTVRDEAASTQQVVRKEAEGIQQATRAEAGNTQQIVRDEAGHIVTQISYEAARNGQEIQQDMQERRRERLCRSLKYDTMNDRIDTIAAQAAGTYMWVVKGIPNEALHKLRPWIEYEIRKTETARPRSRLLPHHGCSHNTELATFLWDCFPCWLNLKAPNNCIYWIQGKPGSGKSTLMRFLVRKQKLWVEKLQPNSQPPVVLSHFIWNAGSSIQRSIKGLLLSLLSELLETRQELQDELLKDFDSARCKEFPTEWHTDDLERILRHCLAQVGQPVFIFLDGLDEIGLSKAGPLKPNMVDTPVILLNLVTKFSKLDNVKLCVSSRPDPEFARQLADCPTLQLQDLTRLDMETFARDLLQPCVDSPSYALTGLINKLCDMANGVFLWTALAVHSIREGLEDDETIEEARLRLLKMPENLYSLYQDMWTRFNSGPNGPLHRAEASRYFNMVRDWSKGAPKAYGGAMHVQHMMLAWDILKAKAILGGNINMFVEELERAYEGFPKKLHRRSAGLLEVRPRGTTVHFIHRSVLEFLDNDPEGQRILEHDRTSPEIRAAQSWEGFLAEVCLRISGISLDGSSRVFKDEPDGVLVPLHSYWDRGWISDSVAFQSILHCKNLWETGLWQRYARSCFQKLDFLGFCAALGLHKFISRCLGGDVPDCSKALASTHYLAYLAVVALSNELQIGLVRVGILDFDGRMQVFSMVKGGEPLDNTSPLRSGNVDVDIRGDKLEVATSPKDVNMIKLLSILNTKAPWPETFPGLDSMVSRYIESGVPLREHVAVTFKKPVADHLSNNLNFNAPRERPDPENYDKGWTLTVDGIWSDNLFRHFHFGDSGWIRLKMSIASLVGLVLDARQGSVARSADSISPKSALDQLKDSQVQYVRVIAFRLGDEMEPRRPSTPDEATSKVMSCLQMMTLDSAEYHDRPGRTSKNREVFPGISYCIPGLWDELKGMDFDRMDYHLDLDDEGDNSLQLYLPATMMIKRFRSQPPP